MITSDIIIIGAGPGGYETALDAASRGLSVTLFERENLGGTCLNRGCIPTKALHKSAEVVDTIRDASRFGVEVDGYHTDFAVAHRRAQEVILQLRQGVADAIKAAGVSLINAEARITPDGTVEAGGETYSAAKVIIATGSRLASLPIPGADKAMTVTELLDADTLPASMVIIGGGVMGMEFSCILNSFGVEVTVVEYCKEVLPTVDADVAKRLRTMLQRRGIKFITGSAVTAVGADGKSVTYSGKKGEATVEAEAVLMAVGFAPVMPEGLEAAGIETYRRGIKVDPATMQTSRPGVYAIGDCNGLFLVAHAATAHGRVALGDDINLSVVPSVIFTSPEVACVGPSVDMLKTSGRSAETMRTRTVQYGASGKAVAMGEPMGIVKLTTDPETDLILSCTILGAHAGDLIQEVALAMGCGLTARQMADTIHSHPTLCELVMMAGK